MTLIFQSGSNPNLELLLFHGGLGSHSGYAVRDGFFLDFVNAAATEDLAVAALGVGQGTLGTPTMPEKATCLSVP